MSPFRRLGLAALAVFALTDCSSTGKALPWEVVRYEGFTDDASYGGNSLKMDVKDNTILRVIYCVDGSFKAVEHEYRVENDRMTAFVEREYVLERVPSKVDRGIDINRKLTHTEELPEEDLKSPSPPDHVNQLRAELARLISFFRKNPGNFKTIDPTFAPR